MPQETAMPNGSSPEQAAAVVQTLYQALLGREADDTGLAHYAGLLATGAIDARTLASLLIGSPEYRATADARSALAGYQLAEAYGCTLLVPDDDALVAELQSAEGYEPWVLPYFLEFCRAGTAVLDIGASIGAFALPAARRVGSEGIVYAVEASPFNCRLLAQSIARNALDNVTLLPLGASDTLGSAQILRQVHTNNNALELEATSTADLASHDQVAVLPLDLLRPAMRPISVLKMDIEGMEYRAARGALALIHADRPIVFLEYSPRFQQRLSGVPGTALIGLFHDLGYRFELLHRTSPRELLPPDDPASAIDAAWQAHVEQGGSHLDLCLHPA
jgi:FkbM family methyltransferase